MSKIKVEGDNNQVYSNIKKSSINSTNVSPKGIPKWIEIGSLLVAAIGVIISIVVNWEAITNFFTK